MEKISEHIYRLVIPYKDIFTTVYAVMTDAGVLVFDAASYDEDIDLYVTPFLEELGVTEDMLKYVFISHHHKDHSGGLQAFMKKYPKTCIISRSEVLQELFADYALLPNDRDSVLDVLKIIPIPGHTPDSSGIYDTRTKTLISGDSLQLYGIYGSGKWGANIRLPREHVAAVENLRHMEIDRIFTAHDYHPFGYHYEGDTVQKALDACIAPLQEVKALIAQNPAADDVEVCAIYNNSDKPTLGDHVVTAVRAASL